MSRAPRAAAVLFTTLLMLLSAAPALAADPVRRAGAARESSVDRRRPCMRCEAEQGRRTAGRRQLLGAWPGNPFIVWGFGYPPEATITLEFIDSLGGIFTFDAITDSAGEFSGDFSFTAESDTIYPETFSLTAVPVGGGCIDGITLTIQRPYPFTDVDGFENEIAWLYREGITGGCTATRFCPSDSVTRGQMAAFLNRALGLPSTGIDFFDDDDGTLFERDINRLAAAGITGGCATRSQTSQSLASRAVGR